MKPVLVLTVLFVTLVNSYPAREKTDGTDVDFDFDPFGGQQPIVDTGYFGNFYPSLDGFYKRLQETISSIRQSVGSGTSGILSSFGDLGKGNTTTYTKIIGNQKVEINETEYKKQTDFGTSHVKVAFINVKPLHPEGEEPGTTTEADTEPAQKPANKDRESLEDSAENEIVPNIDEGNDMDIETFDMNNNRPEFAEEIPLPYRQPSTKSDIENDVNVIKKDVDIAGPIRDLSNDIYVNDIMVADGAPINPFAEFI